MNLNLITRGGEDIDGGAAGGGLNSGVAGVVCLEVVPTLNEPVPVNSGTKDAALVSGCLAE